MDENAVTAESLLAGYRDGLAAGKLLMPRCESCGQWNWYPREMCLNCGSPQRVLVRLGMAGIVHTWTRVRRAVPPVQDMTVPYVTVLVEPSDAAGVRVPCIFMPADRDPVIGEQVRLYAGDGKPGILIARPLGRTH